MNKNSDLEHQEPIYFDSAEEAILHLEGCGYWSAPIQFNTQRADEEFFDSYRASDWSLQGGKREWLRDISPAAYKKHETQAVLGLCRII